MLCVALGKEVDSGQGVLDYNYKERSRSETWGKHGG